VLHGGLPEGHVYLVEGAPGTGKTTLGLQYLLAGRDGGAKRGLLYITLSQTAEELSRIAASHGMDLTGVTIVDLLASEIRDAETAQSVLQTSEEELAGILQEIERAVEAHDPERIVLDGLSEIRLIATSLLRFRRSLLGLKIRMSEKRATVLLIDGLDEPEMTRTAELLAHGAIRMDWTTPDYGVTHRRVQVAKLRGAPFTEGWHDLRIETGGLTISPRLVPEPRPVSIEDWSLTSGNESLDALCGGGLPGNGTTLISGGTGAGKSILCTLFAHQTRARGHPVSLFLFEELPEDFIARARTLGLDLETGDGTATCNFIHIDPAELSPGEVFDRIVREVEAGTRLIVLDSLTGFFHALPQGRGMMVQFNAILNYLKRQKVAVLMTRNVAGILDHPPTTDLDVSFVADNLILMQQHQSDGHIARALTVAKKRYGEHAREVRLLEISADGIDLSPIDGDAPSMGGAGA
jgi:circadian clock protein KaiC